jgi:hypothetical protein
VRKFAFIGLAVAGLTPALLAGPAGAVMNGITLFNAMNGTNATGTINTTGLSLSGVILPAAAR